jgi:hypothetical protein
VASRTFLPSVLKVSADHFAIPLMVGFLNIVTPESLSKF